MIDLTRYKDILGKPGKGIHFHFCGIAIVDVIGTILIGILLSWLLTVQPLLCIGGAFVLGEFLHVIFGVDTAVVRLLGLSRVRA